MAGIPSASNVNDKGQKYWEKTIKDVNNVDESFANARDVGYVRMNQYRTSVVGTISKSYDSHDIYKINVQSNGKLALSVRNDDGSDDKVLDLSKYDQFLDDLKRQNDPEGWAKEQAEKKLKEQNQNLLETTAPGLNIQVYTVKNGKEVLVGDSTADKGSKNRTNFDNMLKGEYRAKSGTYYVKVSKSEDANKREDSSYVMQMSMGDYKHDYAAVEVKSDDSKNNRETKIPMVQSAGGLSPLNAMEIQAARYQATAQMLQVGYMNMADIYNRNSKF